MPEEEVDLRFASFGGSPRRPYTAPKLLALGATMTESLEDLDISCDVIRSAARHNGTH